MEKKSGILILVVVVGLGVYLLLNTSNSENFKGQIFNTPQDRGQEENANPTNSTPPDAAKPDLEITLSTTTPEDADADLKAQITILNIGAGDVSGSEPFTYTINLNGQEIFSNSDTFTSMSSGDSITFEYPISKSIYQYGNEGTITVTVDSENVIEEKNENNNSATQEYSY